MVRFLLFCDTIVFRYKYFRLWFVWIWYRVLWKRERFRFVLVLYTSIDRHVFFVWLIGDFSKTPRFCNYIFLILILNLSRPVL